MTTFRVVHGGRRPLQGPAMVWARCPNMACGADVVVKADADRASCKVCGNQWPWAKSALIRATRGGRG